MESKKEKDYHRDLSLSRVIKIHSQSEKISAVISKIFLNFQYGFFPGAHFGIRASEGGAHSGGSLVLALTKSRRFVPVFYVFICLNRAYN